MEVPFEQVGPGQIGRLAYQVIGRNGPIFNPSNIRYMAPTEFAGDFVTGGAGPLLGIAGVNLAATCGVLTLQAVTLRRIEALSRKLDVVASAVGRIEERLQEIQRRVARIDTKVAESHLRAAIDHAFSRGIQKDEIEIAPLLCLVGDLETFVDSTEHPLLFNFGIRMSSDVRGKLIALDNFLYGLRSFVAERHNRKVEGRPGEVIVVDRARQYVDIDSSARAATAWAAFMVQVAEVVGEAAQGVYDEFMFADEEYRDGLVSNMIERVGGVSTLFEEVPDAGYILWRSTFDESVEIESLDKLQTFFATAASAWLTQSDAALMYRTMRELRALRDGYHGVFYPHIEPSEMPEGPSVLESGCDIARMAA